MFGFGSGLHIIQGKRETLKKWNVNACYKCLCGV